MSKKYVAVEALFLLALFVVSILSFHKEGTLSLSQVSI
jgi:hypothetical protein